jgi:hypothetical protein
MNRDLVRVLERVDDLATRGGDWYRVVSALPKEAQYVWTTHHLEGEVLNGGFEQYFYNIWGQFALDAQAGYEAIGARAHARETARAIKMYTSTYPTHRRFGALGVRPSKPPPRRLFEPVTAAFLGLLGEDTVALRIAYVDTNSGVLGSLG